MLSRTSSSSVIWTCEAFSSSSNASVSLRWPWIEPWKLDSLLNWANPSAPRRRFAFSLVISIRMRGFLTKTKQETGGLQLTGGDIVSMQTQEAERHRACRHVQHDLLIVSEPGPAGNSNNQIGAICWTSQDSDMSNLLDKLARMEINTRHKNGIRPAYNNFYLSLKK